MAAIIFFKSHIKILQKRLREILNLTFKVSKNFILGLCSDLKHEKINTYQVFCEDWNRLLRIFTVGFDFPFYFSNVPTYAQQGRKWLPNSVCVCGGGGK